MMTWTFEGEQLELDLLPEEARLGSQPGHFLSAVGCTLEKLLQNNWTWNIPSPSPTKQASPTNTLNSLGWTFSKGMGGAKPICCLGTDEKDFSFQEKLNILSNCHNRSNIPGGLAGSMIQSC